MKKEVSQGGNYLTPTTLKPPTELVAYIDARISNGKVGKPHLLQELLKRNPDVLSQVLDILEMKWIKNDKDSTIARKYKTSKITIWRLLQTLEPFKWEITEFMNVTPRRKKFYNKETNSSDYATVATYIRRAKRDDVRNYKDVLRTAKRAWTYLKYKTPQNWNVEEVQLFLKTLPDAMQSNMVDAIRAIAPHMRDNTSPDYLDTRPYRARIRRRFKDIFGKEMILIRRALKEKGLDYERTIFELHVTLGAREGSTGDPRAGLCGITWDRFKRNFKRVDIYESKSKGGFWCRNCPVDLLFPHLPEDLRELWKDREKPTNDPVVEGGYKSLTRIYKRIQKTLSEIYQGKVDPHILEEFITMRPHDADKIHCNLLWEAGIPVEVVAGKYLGRGEAIGLMGRVWLRTETITRYYLMLSERSPKMKEYRELVHVYARQFNGGS